VTREELNNERVLWKNWYLGLALTTTPCEACGGDVNFYYRGPKKVATFCNSDVSEMLPALTAFVEEMKAQDDAAAPSPSL
jgi:hypothetical protein